MVGGVPELRQAISPDQLKELTMGLEASGHQFMWVVKNTVMDSNEATKLDDLLVDDGFLERAQGCALVTKRWVEQERSYSMARWACSSVKYPHISRD